MNFHLLVPGVGTLIGGAVGAITGLFGGLFGSKKARER
jgi:gas vesicle protein